jgi:chemotaxis protein MotB
MGASTTIRRTIMKAAVVILALLTLAVSTIGYYFYSANGKLQGELDALRDEKQDLSYKLERMEQERESIIQRAQMQIADISKEKETEVQRLRQTYDELVSDMKSEIEEGKIKITQMADRLSVRLVDRILFPSGEAGITAEGVKVLQRVGNVLKTTQNKIIRVEGHTDNVPISTRLEKEFPTNWELSAARATNVVRFLQDKVGIEPSRLQVVGLSEYQPIAPNETISGRSQNRRIEIALLPQPSPVESTGDTKAAK